MPDLLFHPPILLKVFDDRIGEAGDAVGGYVCACDPLLEFQCGVMSKRLVQIGLVVGGFGLVVWFFQVFKIERRTQATEGQIHTTVETKNSSRGRSETGENVSNTRESPRHLADELEKSRITLADVEMAVRAQEKKVEGLNAFHQLKQEEMQLESQIGSLLNYDNEQLLVYASGLNLPDNVIKTLYPQSLGLNRELEGFRSKGLPDDHPSVKALVDQLGAMSRQLDEGVVNLRSALTAQLDMTTQRLESVEVQGDQTRKEANKSGPDASDYVEAKRNYEFENDLLERLKARLVAEKIRATKLEE